MKLIIRIWVLILIFVFSSVSFCYGQGVVRQYWAKGVDLAAQGKFKDAQHEFGKVLEVEPFSESTKRLLKVIKEVTDKKIERETAIHLFKGISYGNKSEYDKAISHYTKAIKINPDYEVSYMNRGAAYNGKLQFDKAIADLNKALEINPRYDDAYLVRGIVEETKGDLKQAIDDYTQSIEVNPKYANAYYMRGKAYFNRGDYQRAIQDFNQALRFNPNDAMTYIFRAEAYFGESQFKKAISDNTKAIEIDPNNAKFYYSRGIIYDQGMGQYEKAISDYTKAIEINSSYARAYNNRGADYALLGLNDRACPDFQKACELGECRGLRLAEERGICPKKDDYPKEACERDCKRMFEKGELKKGMTVAECISIICK